MRFTNTPSEGMELTVAVSVLLFLSFLWFGHDYAQRKKEKKSKKKKNG